MSSVNLSLLGQRIRDARVARRLTLDDVVSKTAFTVSWLSKIENGLLSPSIEGLVRLAEALDCGVEELIAGLSSPPRFVIDRGSDSPTSLGRNGRSAHPLAQNWLRRSMKPVLLQLNAGNSKRVPQESFAGERFLHVLQGEVTVTYGDEVLRLETGDSMYFDANVPHAIAAAGRGSAQVLSVLHEKAARPDACPEPHNGRAHNGRAHNGRAHNGRAHNGRAHNGRAHT